MSRTRDGLLMWLQHEHGFSLEVPFKGLNGKRRFRFDAARPADVEAAGTGYAGIAVDYQGIGAGHQWHKEQAADHEKQNEAVLCGWVLILCSAVSVNSGRCMEYVEEALRQEVPHGQ